MGRVVYLAVVLTVVGVVVVALLAVGEGVAKTRQMPKQIILDTDEAIEFCAESLPLDVSSVLSYDELRRAMRLHLEWLQAYHWSPEGGAADGPIVFEEFDALEYVMERADVIDLSIERDQARMIISVHTSYLQVMGAIHIDDPALVEADLADLPALSSAEAPPLLASDDIDDWPVTEE